MVDLEKLKKIIKNIGITMTALANNSGIERTTLYNRLNGIGEFTASEIVGLTHALRLTEKERNEIFFANEVEFKETF